MADRIRPELSSRVFKVELYYFARQPCCHQSQILRCGVAAVVEVFGVTALDSSDRSPGLGAKHGTTLVRTSRLRVLLVRRRCAPGGTRAYAKPRTAQPESTDTEACSVKNGGQRG